MYKIKEIFLTKQGEGYHTGKKSIFIRFSGCNLWNGLEQDRHKAICNWCDTDFVGTDGINGGAYTIDKIINKIWDLWPKDLKEKPFLVCTGGEPLLQLDQIFVDEMHKNGFKIAIETNGTCHPPNNIDWICVSPKAGKELRITEGNELKLVYPQSGVDPIQYEKLNFDHFSLQPMDNEKQKENTEKAIKYCHEHPSWRLSLQTHKFIGIP